MGTASDPHVKQPNTALLPSRGEIVEPPDRQLGTGEVPHGAAVVDGRRGPPLQTMSLTMRSEYRGPLPAPRDFREYEQAYPGAADRILTMAEKEGDSRRDRQGKSLDADIVLAKRGQLIAACGFGLVAVLGAALLYAGINIVGYGLLITDLVALLGGSIWNRVEETRQRQLEERRLRLLESEAQKAQQKKGEAQKKNGKRKKN